MFKDNLFHIKQISFKEILPIWQDKLWPNRASQIETHSAMTWPPSYPNQPYNMQVFDYPVYFYGAFINDNLIGVNSGHLTNNTEFRSRGLWVEKTYRGMGIGKRLLLVTVEQARISNANMIWSLPRTSSLYSYKSVGFIEVGSVIDHNVEFGPNIYCCLQL